MSTALALDCLLWLFAGIGVVTVIFLLVDAIRDEMNPKTEHERKENA